MGYVPPFTVSEHAINRVAEISALVERYALRLEGPEGFRLRKANRIHSIHSSCAIEANSLTYEEVTAVLNGRRVAAPAVEIREVENARDAYAHLTDYSPASKKDLLQAHAFMTAGLRPDAGRFRTCGVRVGPHIAPPPMRVPGLVADLLAWLKTAKTHPLIKSCVFHYEFEFIHPFSDGNGRMGRLWHTLILGNWNSVFFDLPIEKVIYRHQSGYYQAIQAASLNGNSAPFIDFMLDVIFETLDELRVSDEVDGVNDGVNDGVKCVLDMIVDTPGANAVKLAKMLKKSKPTIERALSRLKAEGLIAFRGAPKNGGYFKIEK